MRKTKISVLFGYKKPSRHKNIELNIATYVVDGDFLRRGVERQNNQTFYENLSTYLYGIEKKKFGVNVLQYSMNTMMA